MIYTRIYDMYHVLVIYRNVSYSFISEKWYEAGDNKLRLRTTNDDMIQIRHLWKIPITHCGLVTLYGDMELGQHWLR